MHTSRVELLDEAELKQLDSSSVCILSEPGLRIDSGDAQVIFNS